MNSIKNIINEEKTSEKDVQVVGWIKTRRNSKELSFIELNDGSCLKNLQIILPQDMEDYEEASKISTGASIKVTGKLVSSSGKQKIELLASKVDIIGTSDETYILQKKRHSFEFLRDIAHLRPRTNTLSAVFRVRSQLSFAVHNFFNQKGFIYLHAPILTASDCEGAGELFRVTTLDLKNPPKDEDGKIDYNKDFFAKETFLTVSGQLQAEIFAQTFKNTYTFGPTFRAENSNTSRHCAEFWMVEPEMAFCDLKGDYLLAEEFIKYITKHVLDNCQEDLEFFNQWIDKSLLERLNKLSTSSFEVMTYTEAVDILKNSNKKFEYPVDWGTDLQSEHERFLTEEIVKKPVFLINYPETIKPFYMRLNDDNKTVAAMDLLVPGVGEIIGGSQREERYDVLLQRIKDQGMDEASYQWYLDLRKYGSTPHAGFGLGLERMLMYVTGMENIRDVIPFPRTPKSIKY
jgi:asparaginyl-tRNA synthetase